MSNILLVLDTQYIHYKGRNIVYDVSCSLVNFSKTKSTVNFSKTLRNRNIHNTSDNIEVMFDYHFIVYEYANLIPYNKQNTYGYANYMYEEFKDIMIFIKNVCQCYKPDAIIGNNLNMSFNALRSTQSALKTSNIVYMDNENVPEYYV